MHEPFYILSNRTYNYDTNTFHPKSKPSDRGVNLYSTTTANTFTRYNSTKAKALFSAENTWYVFYIHDTVSTVSEGISQGLNFFSNSPAPNSNKQPIIVVPYLWPCDKNPLDNKNKAEDSGFHLFRFLDNVCKHIHNTSKVFVIASGVGACVYRNCVRYMTRVSKLKFSGVYLLEPDISNTSLDTEYEGRYMVSTSNKIVVYYNRDSIIKNNGYLQNRMSVGGIRNIAGTECIISQVDCTNISRYFFNNNVNIDIILPLYSHKLIYDDIISCMFRVINKRRTFYSDRSFLLLTPSVV